MNKSKTPFIDAAIVNRPIIRFRDWLAEHGVDVSRPTIDAWLKQARGMSGGSAPSAENMQKLADILGSDVLTLGREFRLFTEGNDGK